MKNFILLLLIMISYQGIKAQTVNICGVNWCKENLGVIKFNNGETIKEAKNETEWNKLNDEKKPVYFKYVLADGSINIVYNLYAVFDKRGIIPKGYRLPIEKDVKSLNDCFKKDKTLALMLNLKKSMGGISYYYGKDYYAENVVFWTGDGEGEGGYQPIINIGGVAGYPFNEKAPWFDAKETGDTNITDGISIRLIKI